MNGNKNDTYQITNRRYFTCVVFEVIICTIVIALCVFFLAIKNELGIVNICVLFFIIAYLGIYRIYVISNYVRQDRCVIISYDKESSLILYKSNNKTLIFNISDIKYYTVIKGKSMLYYYDISLNDGSKISISCLIPFDNVLENLSESGNIKKESILSFFFHIPAV